MTAALFQLTFYLAAPFWTIMILAPRWSWTPRVLASPWVTLLPLAVYLWFAVPHFDQLWPVVSRPDLDALRGYLAQPYGAALIWAQLIAFDLFIGRWMYFESRARGLPTMLVSPILLLTILLSPLGLIAFLTLRDLQRPPAARRRRLASSSRPHKRTRRQKRAEDSASLA